MRASWFCILLASIWGSQAASGWSVNAIVALSWAFTAVIFTWFEHWERAQR